MKASEIIHQYQTGKRNFQGANLVGESFQGQNLSGADFSYADIRGANFAFSQLSGAKFNGVKTGFLCFWKVILLVLSGIIAGLVGFGCFFLAVFWSIMFSGIDAVTYIAGIFAAIVSFCLYAWLRKSTLFLPQFWPISGGIVGAVIGGVVGAVDYRLLVTLTILGIAAGVTAGLAIVAVALTTAVVMNISPVVTSAAIASIIPVMAVAIAFHWWVAIAASAAIALVVTGCGFALAWLAYRGNRRLNWLNWFTSATAAIGGTSFMNADLTDAEFSDASLQGVDWRGAKMYF